VQPLPIPTYREAVEPLVIPTILTSYMLLHKYIIQNHPPSLSPNMYHRTILHSILTAQTAPFPIQTLPKHYTQSPSPTKGSSPAIPHPLFPQPMPPLPIPTTTMGNPPHMGPHGGYNLHPPILDPWATDPKSKKIGGCNFRNPPFWAHSGSLAHFSSFHSSRLYRPPHTNQHHPTPP